MNQSTLKFGDHVSRFAETHIELWDSCEPAAFSIGSLFSEGQQRTADRQAEELLFELESQLRRYPRSASRQQEWRESSFALLRQFGKSVLGYSSPELELLFQPSYQQVTCDFVTQANEFNPLLRPSDLLQALRNVWIMNSIQMLLGREVQLTPSVFAYSMLYPYTDNFLDDTKNSIRDKRAFNSWIESRICVGSAEGSYDDLEQLFSLIESEHPRATSQEVFGSVLAIQQAQRQSMLQQLNRLESSRLLGLSFWKGGTSVMAHGYLVNGSVTSAQAQFLFGFGVMLQLLDDLQDLCFDLANRHQTIFTLPVSQRQCIDETVKKLLQFMNRVLSGIEAFDSKLCSVLRRLFWRNCVLLLLTAIAFVEEFCSPELVAWLQSHSPLSFESIRRQNRHLSGSSERMQRFLVERKQVTTLWGVLGPASANLWRVRT